MNNKNSSTYKNSSADGVSENKETHGVSQIFNPKSEIEEKHEELIRNGYTTLKNVFSKEDCEIAKEKISSIYKKQIKEIGDEKFLISINDQDVVRALFVYDDFFLKFIHNESIKQLLEISLGKKYILNLQNSPINKAHASHYGSTWHRDLSYQHFVSSRPIAISVLICLDAFTEENGGTHVLPFSHKFEEFPSKKYNEKNVKKITTNIGDAFIFDSILFHRAGPNNTNNERKLLVHMFTLPFVKQQIDFPKMLKGKYSNDEKLSYLLGYDSNTEESVINWRQRRKKRYEEKVIKK